MWGQGDLQSFRAEPSETQGYDGDLRTAYLGVDARVGARWLAGVAVARSGGGGNWRMGASSGRLATELTVAHPYVRWADGDTAVWALAGVGRGTAENVRALTGRRGDSRLSRGLGLVEGRRRLATTGRGLEVDLRGEASWARLRTGDGEETVDGLEAGVRRVRTGVEVTLPLAAPGGLLLAPFGAVSTRHDGGAGQTGVGLELDVRRAAEHARHMGADNRPADARRGAGGENGEPQGGARRARGAFTKPYTRSAALSRVAPPSELACGRSNAATNGLSNRFGKRTVCDIVSDVTQGPPWWCKRLSALRLYATRRLRVSSLPGPSCRIRVGISFGKCS